MKKATKTATTKTRRSKPAPAASEPEVLLGDDTISQAEDEENARLVEATRAANATEAASKPAGKRSRKAKLEQDLAPVTTCTGCGAVNPQVGPNERTACCGAATETIGGEETGREAAQAATGSTIGAQAELAAATAPPVKLTKMTVEELRQVYVDTVQRTTSSTDRGYLQWKIREARKGRIPIGPRQPHGSREPGAFKVVPVRIPTELLARIDQLREKRGIRSRNEFLVQAVMAAVER